LVHARARAPAGQLRARVEPLAGQSSWVQQCDAELRRNDAGAVVKVCELTVSSEPSQITVTRRQLRELLRAADLETAHVSAVVAVANELLGAAMEASTRQPLTLSVELFTLLTSVRVRCPLGVSLRDDPFGMRERILKGFAFAWDVRSRADGRVDLWAELARRSGPF
jgi:hypothetical protein